MLESYLVLFLKLKQILKNHCLVAISITDSFENSGLIWPKWVNQTIIIYI
jgi:hypothetical protein